MTCIKGRIELALCWYLYLFDRDQNLRFVLYILNSPLLGLGSVLIKLLKSSETTSLNDRTNIYFINLIIFY